MDLLFLTPEERDRLFSKLPKALQSAWKDKLREETITTYETPSELQLRIRESKFVDHAGIKALMDKMISHIEQGKKGSPIDHVSMKDLPEDALPAFFFTIGACGTEAFLDLLLQDKDLSEEDMDAVASLSRTRHRLLQMNAVLA